MKRLRIIVKGFILSSLFLLGFIVVLNVKAEVVDNNDSSITIIKYSLSEGALSNNQLPKTPVGNMISKDQAKDGIGNNLSLLSGVSYQIEQVIPSNDSKNPFTVAPGSITKTITTDENGQATIKLPDGIYRVIELANQKISKPADPIIVQLPMKLNKGEKLNNIFIYPKSSVIEPNTSTSSSDKKISRIPQTAGVLPSFYPILGLLVSVISIGLIGLFTIKPRLKR